MADSQPSLPDSRALGWTGLGFVGVSLSLSLSHMAELGPPRARSGFAGGGGEPGFPWFFLGGRWFSTRGETLRVCTFPQAGVPVGLRGARKREREKIARGGIV